MRALYNQTCDVIAGPSSPMPGLVIFSCACRYVPETKELPLTNPLTDREAYVTMDGGIPNGPDVTGGPDTYISDFGWSNLIAIPSGNIPVYQTLFVEVVLHIPTPLYYRAHVRLRPDLSFMAQETLSYLLQEDGSLIVIT